MCCSYKSFPECVIPECLMPNCLIPNLNEWSVQILYVELLCLQWLQNQQLFKSMAQQIKRITRETHHKVLKLFQKEEIATEVTILQLQAGRLHKAKRRKTVQKEDKIRLLKDELTNGHRIVDSYISVTRHSVVSFVFQIYLFRLDSYLQSIHYHLVITCQTFWDYTLWDVSSCTMPAVYFFVYSQFDLQLSFFPTIDTEDDGSRAIKNEYFLHCLTQLLTG